jgi:hypothetical protein
MKRAASDDRETAGSRRRTKGERRIASLLAFIPAAREQLVAAMVEFGDDFDIGALRAAAKGDATARNKVAALERDFELLVNWLDELASRGLAEAQRLGVVEKRSGTGFQRLRANAATLHRGAGMLVGELDRFLDRYERWATRTGVLSAVPYDE